MKSQTLARLVTQFPVEGDNVVARSRHPRYVEPTDDHAGRVYINKTQYFAGIEPHVWEFHIGGYQVLHKWLKDRKDRALTYGDLRHYQRVVVALQETMRIMNEIDAAIPAWPLV